MDRPKPVNDDCVDGAQTQSNAAVSSVTQKSFEGVHRDRLKVVNPPLSHVDPDGPNSRSVFSEKVPSNLGTEPTDDQGVHKQVERSDNDSCAHGMETSNCKDRSNRS